MSMSQSPAVRLWSRLRDCGDGSGTREDNCEEQAVVRSVKEHLVWLLNSRRGDSPACPKYGMPDLSGIIAGLPKSENEFSQQVESSIREFEPRISWVRVRVSDGTANGGWEIHFTVEVGILFRDGVSSQHLQASVDLENVYSIG